MRHTLKSSHAWLLVGAVLFSGCARTKFQSGIGYGGLDTVPRPAYIIVKDFDISPEQIELDTSPGRKLARRKTDAELTRQAIGAAVANALSARLVSELQKRGLPAHREEYVKHIPKKGSQVAIEGEFLTVDEGRRTGRLVVGFGLGSAEVVAQTKMYLEHPEDRQLLQQFQSATKSGIRPGIGTMVGVGAVAGTAATAAAVSSGTNIAGEKVSGEVRKLATAMAKAIVKNLEPFFEEQGWL